VTTLPAREARPFPHNFSPFVATWTLDENPLRDGPEVLLRVFKPVHPRSRILANGSKLTGVDPHGMKYRPATLVARVTPG